MIKDARKRRMVLNVISRYIDMNDQKISFLVASTLINEGFTREEFEVTMENKIDARGIWEESTERKHPATLPYVLSKLPPNVRRSLYRVTKEEK